MTIVLISAETYRRPCAYYEVKRSYEMGKGMLSIHIRNINAPKIGTDIRGQSPYEQLAGGGRKLSTIVPTYDWVLGDGYGNLAACTEKAAQLAGR